MPLMHPMSPSVGIGFMQFYFCIQVHTGPQVCLLGWILITNILLFAAWMMCSYNFGDHGDHTITCRGLSLERITDPYLHINAQWTGTIWHDARYAIETIGSLLTTHEPPSTAMPPLFISSMDRDTLFHESTVVASAQGANPIILSWVTTHCFCL